MLYFLISVKNVGANFSPDQSTLGEMANTIKNLLKDQNPEVFFEFSRAKRFKVNSNLGKIQPSEPVLVEVFPQGGSINREMVAPYSDETSLEIVSLAILFMTLSDPDLNLDFPIHTSITPCPGITYKYIDHTIVDSF